MNMLKNFIQIKSKKTMTYHYSHCLFIATYYEKREAVKYSVSMGMKPSR